MILGMHWFTSKYVITKRHPNKYRNNGGHLDLQLYWLTFKIPTLGGSRDFADNSEMSVF